MMPFFLFFPAPIGDGYFLEFELTFILTNSTLSFSDLEDTIEMGNADAAGAFPLPAAYWSFDNAALLGTTVLDLVNGYNATNQAGATSGSVGQIAQGVSYSSATTGRADLGDTPSDLQVSTYTHSMWVNFNSIAAGLQALYSFGDATGDQAILFEGTPEEINYISFFTPVPTVNTNTPLPVRSLTTGVWNHFAMVRDVVGNELRGYFNGERIATFTLDGATAYYGTADDNVFAARGSTGTQSADCILDEFGYWIHALTDEQIQDVYLQGLRGLKLVD